MLQSLCVPAWPLCGLPYVAEAAALGPVLPMPSPMPPPMPPPMTLPQAAYCPTHVPIRQADDFELVSVQQSVCLARLDSPVTQLSAWVRP